MGNIRKQRGYNWEIDIEKYFNDYKDVNSKSHKKTDIWKGKRMAPSSTRMPDVMVTFKNILFSIEAKSTAAEKYYVRLEQLHNSSVFAEYFPLYPNVYVAVSFYFMTKQRTKDGYIPRNMRNYTLVYTKEVFDQLFLEHRSKVKQIDCHYNGQITYRTLATLESDDVETATLLDEAYLNENIKTNYPFIKFNSLKDFIKYFSKAYNNSSYY